METDRDAAGDPVEIRPVVERLFRTESARLVGLLTRLLGPAHLALAEDVAQDALAAALAHWPLTGVPLNPSAWLLQVARRKALDALRRESALAERAPTIARELEALAASNSAPDATAGDAFVDDQLRMILMCCHPAISRDAHVTLTLSVVAGFSAAEVARAFVADERTVAQRLVRAKRALRDAQVTFEVPPVAEIPARLDAVLDVLYLMFNEGHTARDGTQLLRRDLCNEALRLTELLLTHPATAAPRVHALAALFCFHSARLNARTDAIGALVRLPAQDRSRWDQRLVVRGAQHLAASATGDEITPYHLEAEIAWRHATAASWDDTDWAGIVDAYDKLLAFTNSSVVALNRVVAVWRLRGAPAALDALDAPGIPDRLADYHLYHAVRGELLAADGRLDEATAAFREALTRASLTPERDAIQARLSNLESPDVGLRR